MSYVFSGYGGLLLKRVAEPLIRKRKKTKLQNKAKTANPTSAVATSEGSSSNPVSGQPKSAERAAEAIAAEAAEARVVWNTRRRFWLHFELYSVMFSL